MRLDLANTVVAPTAIATFMLCVALAGPIDALLGPGRPRERARFPLFGQLDAFTHRVPGVFIVIFQFQGDSYFSPLQAAAV